MSDPTRFAHYATITAGVLIAGLCGACTLMLTGAPENAVIAPIAWVVGGAPTLFGVWLILHGVKGLSPGGRK